MQIRTFAIAVFALPALFCSAANADEYRQDGKLLLTGGVSSVDGAAGGGLANWAVIGGNETEDGIGASAHGTFVALPDFNLAAAGFVIGWHDRVEVSYTHQRFDTRAAGAALGLGQGFAFSQDIVGAKVKLIGDAVWDQRSILPQIAVGVQSGHADRTAIIKAIGGRQANGTDFYVSATKVVLSQSLVLDGTVRWTKANQFGLLGYGGDADNHRTAQFEGSAGMLVTANLLVGAEYRTKPNNLKFAYESDSYDLFAALAVGHHVAVTAAWVDLGPIATYAHQRGIFASLQGSF